MIAIVATSYKLGSELPLRFLRDHAGNRVHLVTDEIIFCLDGHSIVRAPEMQVFSITKCSNLGIDAAIKAGADIIVKTDIDCILDNDFIKFVSANISDGTGAIFRYWGVTDASMESRLTAKLLPRICGTCAMTSHDWRLTGGYCDAMQGYGYDDWDICMRARTAGVKMEQLTYQKVYHIDHGEKHNATTINPINRAFNKALGQR